MPKNENKTYDLYRDINERCQGDIYIGVVGPVRTGKSTFIKRFMDLMVIPNIENEHEKARAKDELPQSATGKTIMTTEPKFIPKESANIKLSDDISFNFRMIDCVGYMVETASGHIENDAERMVKTPWFNYEIPFTKAAEAGTRKVIEDHSTIGIIVTCDGSFSDIERKHYEKPEEQTANELAKLGKPYVIVLNSSRPYAKETIELAKMLSDKYKVSVIPIDCEQLKEQDVHNILESILYEFPINEISFSLPEWFMLLEEEAPMRIAVLERIESLFNNIFTIRDITNFTDTKADEYVEEIAIKDVSLAKGCANICIKLFDKFYYEILSTITGSVIKNDYELISTIKEMSKLKNEYSKVSEAMYNVKANGYGVVSPSREEIDLAEPTITKNGNRYGVKINAKAPSIHMIRADILTEIAPLVGTEQQAKDLIDYIKVNENQDNNIWETNIFGKNVEQIVSDGINDKIHNMSVENVDKIRGTIEKVMNDNSGLVCIMLG